MTEKNVPQSETVKVYPVPESPITEDVLAHIQSVAAEMLRHSSYRKSDFEDICQDLAMEVIKAFDRYDNTRSSYYTYAQIVIGCGRNFIYRERIRKGLDNCNASIDSIGDSDPLLLDENALSPEMTLMNKERAAMVREIISQLKPFQQRICNMIMDNVSMREIMVRCHLTQSQLYHRILPEIQQDFNKKMKNYQK